MPEYVPYDDSMLLRSMDYPVSTVINKVKVGTFNVTFYYDDDSQTTLKLSNPEKYPFFFLINEENFIGKEIVDLYQESSRKLKPNAYYTIIQYVCILSDASSENIFICANGPCDIIT